jgi:hypothetical protein
LAGVSERAVKERESARAAAVKEFRSLDLVLKKKAGSSDLLLNSLFLLLFLNFPLQPIGLEDLGPSLCLGAPFGHLSLRRRRRREI